MGSNDELAELWRWFVADGREGIESQRPLAYVHPHGSVLEWIPSTSSTDVGPGARSAHRREAAEQGGSGCHTPDVG